MRVAVLTTGKMEWHGLHLALERLFPGQHFYRVPTEAEVSSSADDYPYPGFTSVALNAGHVSDPPEALLDLIERAAREALQTRDGGGADHVVVVDDVELCNLGQEAQVVEVVRAGVQRYLDDRPAACERIAEALRSRVSFHLARPMIEAWLFADPAALARAGVANGEAATLPLEHDPEAFSTSDPAYLAATDASCPCWVEDGRKAKTRPKWLGAGPREQHPKGYLQWLCVDGARPNCTHYSESDVGADALRELGWGLVLSRPEGQLAYLRALLADLAASLDQAPSTGAVASVGAATAAQPTGGHRLLRNL